MTGKALYPYRRSKNGRLWLETEVPQCRAVSGGNGGYAGVVAGRDGNVQAAHIRGRHEGMGLVGIGDGLENVSSKIQKVWKR